MKYTVETLKKENTAAARAARELIEFSHVKADTGLDMSMETYEHASVALMAAGVDMMRKGLNEADIRERLVFLAASYEMYALCNFVCSFSKKDCVIEQGVLSPHPVLRVGEVRFDVYKAFEDVKEDCFIFLGGALAVDVSPARERIGEFLDKIDG